MTIVRSNDGPAFRVSSERVSVAMFTLLCLLPVSAIGVWLSVDSQTYKNPWYVKVWGLLAGGVVALGPLLLVVYGMYAIWRSKRTRVRVSDLGLELIGRSAPTTIKWSQIVAIRYRG